MDDIKKGIIILLGAFCVLMSACTGDIEDKIIIESGKSEISLSIVTPDTLNPIRTASDSVSELMALVYEPLFEFDSELKAIGCLAKSCVLNSDNTAATVSLNFDKEWHDGTAFTAADVIYTINEIKRNKSMYKHNVEYIAAAEETADGGVYITFYEPVMNPEGLLSFPVIKAESADVIEQNPIGTGKFKVQEAGATQIILTPYRDDELLSLEKVKVSVKRNAQTCISAFETGELDVITSSAVDLGEVTPGGDISFGNYTANFMTFLGFNCEKEIFVSPYVRLAVKEIINSSEIIEKAIFSRGEQCNIPINPQSRIYKEADILEIDVEGAMEKAGFSYEGDCYRNDEGDKLSVGILVTNENGKKLHIAEMIEAQLVGAGIDAYTISLGFSDYIKRIEAGEYDMFVGEVEMKDNLDPGFLTDEGNYFAYSDSDIDMCLGSMRRAKDTDSLYLAVGEYARAFSMNPPFVPLFYRVDSVVYSNSLSGMTEPVFYNRLGGIEKWYFKAYNGKGTDSQ